MKPILIDALHICMGGGKVLLDYLLTQLLKKEKEFMLIKDARCAKLSCEDKIGKIEIIEATTSNRLKFYQSNRTAFSLILCFGNVPPPIKMPCKVYTYVHNINLLNIPSEFPLKRKFINWLKQKFIALLASNTDGWIVQTNNTKDCLLKVLPHKNKQVLVLPFYNISECLKLQKNNLQRSGYILAGDFTGTRGHKELLEAMRILKQKGVTPKLHLTVSKDNPFTQEIKKAVQDGIRIENHGIIPFNQMVDIYGSCTATIYPSINESLGLGIIEAIEAGCDVIVSDLPFAHAICKPSEVFTHRTPLEISNAILRYEKGESPKSKLIINNNIDELLNLITKS